MHAFAHTRLTDNTAQFTTRRYCDNPLSVQGAGAFADVMRIAESLQARA